MVAFGTFQIYETATHGGPNQTPQRKSLPASSLMLGLALTGLNPYFILWWLTIGSVLIIQALVFGALLGVILMYIAHVWMDFAFLTGLAYFARRGVKIFGSKYYRGSVIAFGVVLICYGVIFVSAAF